MIKARVIAISAGTFKEDLRKMAGRIRRTAKVSLIGAKAVEVRLRAHFRDLNQKPNKDGWQKSNFWAQIRDSTQTLNDGDAGVVQINDPRFNLKFFGGVVTPKNADALSIPLHAEFKGLLPSMFPKGRFFFLPSHDGKNVGVLAEALGDHTIRAAYLLRKSTTHKPQADALPPLDELRETAVEAMRNHILRGSD